MMLRRAMVKLLGALTVLAGIGASQDASAAEVIKIGTLAPKASPWGQVFSVWEKAVKEKSGGRLELQFFYNGQQGDEGAMVGKMKAGQLDGAAVTAVGLGKIHKPILALQMPGLFTSWAKLDAAREAMRPEFEKGAADAGFSIVGWGDVGQAHLMTKGVAIRTPDDFKGTKPYVWRDDAMMPVFFQVVGGTTPFQANIPEVLPNLNTGAINAIVAPAVVAEQLQWASKLDHIVADASGFAVGALVLTSKKLDGLPADLKAILQDTGKVASAALTKRIRSEDDAAFGRLKGKMTVIELTADQKAKWQGLFKQVRGRLAQGTFPADVITKLEGLGG
ncbi:TRAP transporter substrate-binding protein DctP [Polyangium sp. 15x6]|uniref:TRAP transporter substrate-binding protein DctP n=1 Tax=Polyangium sp. 15x6 TaxID=3042687 RepID=UPI00249B72DC|nr:TRAP transporter substrate-binding protein DctP [Polyangium sp. 15x6]MDI3286968.1 TRAP transporter substrate-binding protein DctP [Polyangium sp. 15x6]